MYKEFQVLEKTKNQVYLKEGDTCAVCYEHCNPEDAVVVVKEENNISDNPSISDLFICHKNCVGKEILTRKGDFLSWLKITSKHYKKLNQDNKAEWINQFLRKHGLKILFYTLIAFLGYNLIIVVYGAFSGINPLLGLMAVIFLTFGLIKNILRGKNKKKESKGESEAEQRLRIRKEMEMFTKNHEKYKYR